VREHGEILFEHGEDRVERLISGLRSRREGGELEFARSIARPGLRVVGRRTVDEFAEHAQLLVT